jgi:uncharacterized protein (DUF983 family)
VILVSLKIGNRQLAIGNHQDVPPVKSSRPTIKDAVIRGVTLRCPACGQASIIDRPFRIAERCASCCVLFKREEGFFVGAILINVVITEAIILLAYLISIPLMALHYQYGLGLLFVLAILFPIAFYHHSWSLWLTFDHLVEGLPKET